MEVGKDNPGELKAADQGMLISGFFLWGKERNGAANIYYNVSTDKQLN